MTLRCKSGDVCMIVGRHEDAGRFVGCVIRVTSAYESAGSVWGPFWHYEGPPLMFGEYPVEGFADSILLPLNPGPGEDEMILKAGRAFETPAELIDSWASAGPAA